MSVHLFPRRALPRITMEKLAFRFGCFVIADKVFELWPEAVQAVMGQCIVLCASYCEMESYTLYTAISEQFDRIADNAPVPVYTWKFGGPKPVAERLAPEGGDAA